MDIVYRSRALFVLRCEMHFRTVAVTVHGVSVYRPADLAKWGGRLQRTLWYCFEHRRKLRYLLGVVYPHHMSNAKVYASTRQGPVSTTCRRRRLLWLGHVVRKGRNTASYQALEIAIKTRDIKRPRGRPHLRWREVVMDLTYS